MKIRFKDMVSIIEQLQQEYIAQYQSHEKSMIKPTLILENLIRVTFKTTQFIKLVLNFWISRANKDERKRYSSKLRYFLHRYNQEEENLQLDEVIILEDDLNESKSTQNKNYPFDNDSFQSEDGFISQVKQNEKQKNKSTLKNTSQRSNQLFLQNDGKPHKTLESNDKGQFLNVNKNSGNLNQQNLNTPIKQSKKKKYKKKKPIKKSALVLKLKDNPFDKGNFLLNLENEKNRQEYINKKLLASIQQGNESTQIKETKKTKSVFTIKPHIKYLSIKRQSRKSRKDEKPSINLYQYHNKGGQSITLMKNIEKFKVQSRENEVLPLQSPKQDHKQRLEKQIQLANIKISAQNSFILEEENSSERENIKQQEKQIKVKAQSLQMIPLLEINKNQQQEQESPKQEQILNEENVYASLSNMESLKDDSLLIDNDDFENLKQPPNSEFSKQQNHLQIQKQLSESKITKEYPQCQEFYSSQVLLHNIQKLDAIKSQEQYNKFKKQFTKTMQELEKTNIIRFVQEDKKSSFIKKSQIFKPYQITQLINTLTSILNQYEAVSSTKVKLFLNKSKINSIKQLLIIN